METVDGLQFEVDIFGLLDSGFDVADDDRIVVFALANVLEKTAVANFAGCDVDTPEIKYNFAE